MITVDQLVGRLMDLETKFYELQDRYQTLINDYENLKNETDSLRHRDNNGSQYDPFVRDSGH